jgi:hypothetical protein
VRRHGDEPRGRFVVLVVVGWGGECGFVAVLFRRAKDAWQDTAMSLEGSCHARGGEE